MSLAPIFIETGEVDKGIGMLEKALVLTPSYINSSIDVRAERDILFNLAKAYVIKGDDRNGQNYFALAQEKEAFGRFVVDQAAKYGGLSAADYTRVFQAGLTEEAQVDEALAILGRRGAA